MLKGCFLNDTPFETLPPGIAKEHPLRPRTRFPMKEFLATLEPLSHQQRVRRVREDFPSQAPDGNSFYERQLALYAAIGRGEEERLLKTALSDPSIRLRCRAVRALSACAREESALEVLDRLEPRLRMRFLRSLYKRKRHGVIDSWFRRQEVPPVETLAYASTETLDRHQGFLLDLGTNTEWCRLTRRRPDWVVRNFLQGDLDGRTQSRAGTVIQALCKMRSLLAWKAWRSAASAGLILTNYLEDRVFDVCYREMTAFALETIAENSGFTRHDSPRWDFSRKAHLLDPRQVEELVRRGWLGLGHRWWKKLSPEERVLFWSLAKEAQVGHNGAISVVWLSPLPHRERTETARQQSRLGVIEIDPGQLCPYLAMLGWKEGNERLRAFMTSPDPVERAAGLAAFVRLAYFEPEHMDDVLLELGKRSNEPDPVRNAFLAALGESAPVRIQDRHLPLLAQVLQHLFNAADASAASFGAAERVLLRLLETHPEWATEQLVRLVRHSGHPHSTEWSRALETPGVSENIDRALEGLLSEWAHRERYSSIFALASRMGRRLEKMSLLPALLSRLCRHKLPNIAKEAFSRIFWGAPGLQRELVPQLVGEDLSWVSQFGIADWLHRHRQDLLTPVLRGDTVTGKFASGQSLWVLHLEGGFWRWTPSQQRVYAELLTRLLADRERDFWAQRYCLHALAQLPDVEPTMLVKSARLTEERQAIRDEALRCLARVEDGKGLSALLEALDDERGRVAIYSLRRLLLDMPSERALDILLSVNSSKVTVRKEVSRLLGELPNRVGLAALLERLRTETHRDVRIAMYRGLWPHLEDESVRSALLQAADSPDEAVGRALAQIPSDRLGGRGRALLDSLLLKLLAHPSRRVRYAVLRRLSDHPLKSMSEELSASCTELLELEPEGTVAAGALLKSGMREPERWDSLLVTILPKRKPLRRLVDALRGQAYSILTRHLYREVLEVTVRRLLDDPTLALLRIELVASTGSTEEFLVEFEGAWRESPVAPVLPLSWRNLLTLHAYRLDRASYQKISHRWRQKEDDMLERLTFEAFMLHTSQYGWSDENRAELESFKADGSLLTKLAAQFVHPTSE